MRHQQISRIGLVTLVGIRNVMMVINYPAVASKHTVGAPNTTPTVCLVLF